MCFWLNTKEVWLDPINTKYSFLFLRIKLTCGIFFHLKQRGEVNVISPALRLEGEGKEEDQRYIQWI